MLTREARNKDLAEVIGYFYEAYHVTGRYNLFFEIRAMPDSDGMSVVDTYLCPCFSGVIERHHAMHIPLLRDVLEPEILGFSYDLEIQREPGRKPRLVVFSKALATEPDQETQSNVFPGRILKDFKGSNFSREIMNRIDLSHSD